MNSNEIYDEWSNFKEIKRCAIRIGIFSEKLINDMNFQKIYYYLICVYITLIELQKHLSLIQTFILNNSIKILFPSIQYILDYFLIEKYCSIEYTNFSLIFFTCILLVQFSIVAFLCSNIFFQGNRYTILPLKFQQIFSIIINLILLLFPYSFNYLNLNFLFNLNSRDSLSGIIRIINLFIFISFHLVYLTYIYIYNDVSPTKNKYFFSVTNPIHNIFNFFRFFLYNLLLTTTNYSSKNYILIWIIIIYLALTFLFTIFKVYFIHRHYYYISLSKTLFFLTSLMFNLIFYQLGFDIVNNRYYILVISIIFFAISLSTIGKIRINNIYSVESLNDNLLFSNKSLNEIFLYHLLSKKSLNYNDILKHKKLCSLFPLEPCICKSDNSIDIADPQFIKEIKFNSCLFISKINKVINNIDQIYIKIFLDNNELHESLFLYYMKFSTNKIPIYKEHLVIRNLFKFNELYINFYNSPQDSHQKINIITITEIFTYEKIYSNFLKNIKKTKNLSLKFWEVIKKKPINKADFFKYGMEISNKVISISQDFGKMQTIQPNKIHLLKIYTHFIKAVFHDKEYVNYLLNLIKENLQMMKLNSNLVANYNDKEFGLLVISGNGKNLFNIISYNKLSKQFFSDRLTLKNVDIHNLLPFPFNIIHRNYLKENFNNYFLSKERNIFCINHKGDLSFINANIIPIVNFHGDINFYMLFYLSKEINNSIKAFFNENGLIFAATNRFKEEYMINLNQSFKFNSKLMQILSKQKNSLHSLIHVNNFRKVHNYQFSYPYIYDLIEETGILLREKIKYNKNIEKNEFLNVFKRKNKIQNKSVFETSCIKDILYSEGFLSSYKTKDSSKNLKSEVNINKECTIYPVNSNESLSKSFKSVKKFDGLNSKVISTMIIHKNKEKYEMEIKENTSLSGFFNYFSVDLKVLKNNNFTLKTNNSMLLRSNHTEMLDFTIEINNKISLYLIKYQKNLPFFSQSKIFKKIYYYYALIFIILIIMSVLISWHNLNEYSNYRENCQVFDGFLYIEHKLVLMLMNLEYLTYYRYISSINNTKKLQEKIKYTKNYLRFDLTSLENFLQGFIKKDLSSSFQFQDTIQSQSLQISHLSNDYLISYSNYTFNQALNIYFVEIKSFLDYGSEEIRYFEFNNKNSSSSMNYERSLFFFNDNYFNSIRIISKHLTDSRLIILSQDINRNSVLFNLQNIIFCGVFSIILVLLFILLRDIYLIDSSLVYFYLRLDDIYIDNLYEYLKSNLSLPTYQDLNEKSFLLKTHKTIKKFYKKDKFKHIENNDSIQNICTKQGVVHSRENGIITTTSECQSQEKFLLNKEINSLFNRLNIMDSFNSSKKKYSKLIDIKHLWRVGIYKNFYLKKFIKAMLLVVSLSYFYIIQVFIHPHSSYSVENFLIQLRELNRKIIFNNLIVETLLTNIRINSTVFDKNNSELFQFYFDKIIQVNHDISNLPKEKYFYDFDVREKINTYNSLNFCSYFFNASFSEKIILMPEESYNDCISSPIYFGIDVYLSQMKNSLTTIYSSFKNSKIRVINNLKELITKKTIDFAHIGLGFYSRIYRDDIHSLFFNSLNSMIDICCLYVKISFVSFIIQLCLYSAIIYFRYREKINIHFEKKRILLSMLPIDNKSNIKIQINNLLNRYF